MSQPTVTCLIVQTWVTAPFPVPDQFNYLVLKTAAGANYLTYKCDPDYSTFVPKESGFAPLTSTEFNEIWPYCIAILVAGYLVRRMIEVFS